jgi:hypothetical protein
MQTHKEPRRRTVRSAMREASELPQPSIVDVDPEDPAQVLDDAGQFSVTDLNLDAEPAAEADAEVDAAAAEVFAEDEELEEDSEVDASARDVETPSETTADAYAAAVDGEDTGELYGLHTPHATDHELDKTPDQESFVDSEQGENWLETLEKKAAEGGAEAEEDLEVVDNSDELGGHHSTESGDRPVADKGSGGEGGL